MARPHIAVAALLLCGVTAAGGWFLDGPDAASAASTRQLRTEDMVPANVMPLVPADAKAINERQPFSLKANPAASPFAVAYNGDVARMRSLDCLTQAIYYEAANEPTTGQKAVAQVVLNRVRHVAYPNSVCGVVYQGSERRTGCQFTFTCDGSLRRTPSVSGWARARKVAEAALAGEVFAPVGYSTHYHADYVVPYWSSSLLKTAVLGRHIFYRSPGAGTRAFSARYAGSEPAVSATFSAESASAPKVEEYASVSFIDFDEMAERPPEEKAREFDKFGLLDYRDEDKARAPATMPASDTAAEAAIASAFAARSKAAVPAMPVAPPSPAS